LALEVAAVVVDDAMRCLSQVRSASQQQQVTDDNNNKRA